MIMARTIESRKRSGKIDPIGVVMLSAGVVLIVADAVVVGTAIIGVPLSLAGLAKLK